MLPFFVLKLIGLLLAGPVSPPHPPTTPAVPPWLARCLPQLQKTALTQGAPLPIDSPRGAEYGTCAARCNARCFLQGDFDGDGQKELAVASPTELLFFHDVERKRDRRALLGRIPLSGQEVALISLRRTIRFADEVGLLRDGQSPMPILPRNEHLVLGLILWHNVADANDEDDEDDDEPHGKQTGDLMVAIFDETTTSYRLQTLLQLGGAP